MIWQREDFRQYTRLNFKNSQLQCFICLKNTLRKLKSISNLVSDSSRKGPKWINILRFNFLPFCSDRVGNIVSSKFNSIQNSPSYVNSVKIALNIIQSSIPFCCQANFAIFLLVKSPRLSLLKFRQKFWNVRKVENRGLFISVATQA